MERNKVKTWHWKSKRISLSDIMVITTYLWLYTAIHVPVTVPTFCIISPSSNLSLFSLSHIHPPHCLLVINIVQIFIHHRSNAAQNLFTRYQSSACLKARVWYVATEVPRWVTVWFWLWTKWVVVSSDSTHSVLELTRKDFDWARDASKTQKKNCFKKTCQKVQTLFHCTVILLGSFPVPLVPN